MIDVNALLDSRLKKRADEFPKKIDKIAREASRDGKLNSGALIKQGHDLLIAELNLASSIICSSLRDSLIGTHRLNLTKNFHSLASERLQFEKESIEQIYFETTKQIMRQAHENPSLNKYLYVGDEFSFIANELTVEVAKIIGDFKNSLGNSKWKRFLRVLGEHWVLGWVVGILSATGLGTLAEFLMKFFSKSL